MCCHFVSPNDKLTRNRPQTVLMPAARAKFGTFLCRMVEEADPNDAEGRWPTLDELRATGVSAPMQTMWVDKRADAMNSA
jgi:hypothetical protein